MSRPSKGIRKHIRQEKARKKKEEFRKIQEEQKRARFFASLPNWEDIPKAKTSRRDYNWHKVCPKCEAHAMTATAKEITTKQGRKIVEECNSCQTIYQL